MKNILLATTGASPQVLTETLFAIHQSGKPFPDEVFVITTQSAKVSLMNGLFRDGHLQALINEYDLPPVVFDESHIWLIEDHEGNPIDDAKSVEDQTYMADFITRKVFSLTQDGNCAIHASLAGGRKTMAFYFGYAMSLFGREQDTLSHVFVDDEYEFVRDFWYPTKEPKWVTGKNGQGEVDVSKATVTLAEIPFVRMRNSIDKPLLNSMMNYSFSQAVGLLNASHSEELTLNVDISAKTLEVVGVEIALTHKELAFYLWLFDKGVQGVVVDRYFEDDPEHSISFLAVYSEMATDPRVFESFGSTPEDFAEGDHHSLKGMQKEFLQPLKSTINKKIKLALPDQTASTIEIMSQKKGAQTRYWVNACPSEVTVKIV
ncbi:TIGR02584 family CRISPR-associated protein [Enterovibrio norvegicus]|uniref:CRISPR-associated ring nuclease Csm6 n=1 Tax=Enterovibrio norvegicus TaxID=188144 RepID=UPI0010BE401C|nr:CRISPR-associated ring nuclease Csm6 [Enterovibrio norvegicus]TKF13383.1 TIGR02584 family CRISPR-associated protein [Enterovibrio norvegicus]